MRKLKTLVFLFAALITNNVMAQTITASDVEIDPSGSADVIFSVNAEEKAALAEFMLSLPEGITVAYDEDEEDYVYEKGSSMLVKTHTVTITPTADGKLYVLVKNESGKEFKAESGEYLTVTLNADANVTGVLEGKMEEIGLFRLDATQMNTVTEYNFKITIKGTPVGIQEVEAANANAPIYNLGGQRVEKTAKGLYIKNGKKVVVK